MKPIGFYMAYTPTCVDPIAFLTGGSMRYVALLCIAVVSITGSDLLAQTRSTGAGGQSEVRACAVLTRDLVAPLTENKTILDLIPAKEEVLANKGAATAIATLS